MWSISISYWAYNFASRCWKTSSCSWCNNEAMGTSAAPSAGLPSGLSAGTEWVLWPWGRRMSCAAQALLQFDSLWLGKTWRWNQAAHSNQLSDTLVSQTNISCYTIHLCLGSWPLALAAASVPSTKHSFIFWSKISEVTKGNDLSSLSPRTRISQNTLVVQCKSWFPIVAILLLNNPV